MQSSVDDIDLADEYLKRVSVLLVPSIDSTGGTGGAGAAGGPSEPNPKLKQQTNKSTLNGLGTEANFVASVGHLGSVSGESSGVVTYASE